MIQWNDRVVFAFLFLFFFFFFLGWEKKRDLTKPLREIHSVAKCKNVHGSKARISPWPLAGNRSCILLGSRSGFVSHHYSLVRYSRTVTWKRLTKSPPYEATKLLYRPRAGSLIWFTIGLVSLSVSPSSLSPLFTRACTWDKLLS